MIEPLLPMLSSHEKLCWDLSAIFVVFANFLCQNPNTNSCGDF